MSLLFIERFHFYSACMDNTNMANLVTFKQNNVEHTGYNCKQLIHKYNHSCDATIIDEMGGNSHICSLKDICCASCSMNLIFIIRKEKFFVFLVVENK